MMSRVNLMLAPEFHAKDFSGNATSVSKHSGRVTGTTSMATGGASTTKIASVTKHADHQSVAAYNRATKNKISPYQSLL